MQVVAIIPARYAAARFPGKLMKMLGDRTVIRHTYENTLASGLFSRVLVATDSEEILHEIVSHGGEAVLSARPHESGTDRIAEAAERLQADIILNVQGDEPFVKREPLEKLLAVFCDPEVRVASLMQELSDPRLIADPNYVKVVTDLRGNALYFSRSVVPYDRDQSGYRPYYEHIGVYAFRKEALLAFTGWAPTPLETAERIECLRFLEHGVPIRMVATRYVGIEIDTPEDLEQAGKLFS